MENTTEADWTGVGLTLVSGRPISFVMDLYQPLYVPRPVEEMELYASLRPPVYEEDLAARKKQFLAKADAAAAPAPPPAAAAPRMAMRARAAGEAEEKSKRAEAGWDLSQGVQPAAAAAEVGELFQYDIATPVTLPRQQSAMLPIVNAEVQGEKLSIYNPQVHAKHPLNGLKLVNTTDLHLMQGPITVFDGGVYAGDAKILDLPPKGERLISYALDLDTEVAPEAKPLPDQLLSVRLQKGLLLVTRKFTRVQQYTVKNSGRRPKRVLIEYPIDTAWTLVEPQEPAERTRDHYRFALEAKPGEPAQLAVKEERVEGQQIALSNIDDNTIVLYRSAPVVSQQVKEALGEVLKRKHELQQVQVKRQQLEARIQEITADQERIRQNMAQLDRTSDVYKNYVKKFSDQETEIEQLRAQIRQLIDQEAQLRKALDEYLMGLDLG